MAAFEGRVIVRWRMMGIGRVLCELGVCTVCTVYIALWYFDRVPAKGTLVWRRGVDVGYLLGRDAVQSNAARAVLVVAAMCCEGFRMVLL